MERTTYPLSIPDELYEELAHLANKTGLPMADILRQAAKLGLPDLEQRLAPRPAPLKLYMFLIDPKYWDDGISLILADSPDQARTIFLEKHGVNRDSQLANVEQPDCIEGVTGEGPAREMEL